MRHYEIVLMIHPDHSDQVTTLTKLYIDLIQQNQGIVHRMEDWGKRQLAYSINNLHKSHYILLNIEIPIKIINELEQKFRFNDIIIRSIIISKKEAITVPSPMLQNKEDNKNISIN
ncbi:30S ribosomal protein S6 [Buchnera aphidicola (Thelaxes californica)]|uniref:Small ribosomal subunit protein bS6 n=1 Tax=Buchnera aphidicola (Thelaxes californica) TaxID=1315998 RepID=A0A4D6YMH6_9GAMM|nr:30S ribosomal protein S6 [Buchnera aphidicola]QCI26958.1 30S ribosomal protein S6 [Buchnera aphidicola (Thelaxes californica)]